MKRVLYGLASDVAEQAGASAIKRAVPPGMFHSLESHTDHVFKTISDTLQDASDTLMKHVVNPTPHYVAPRLPLKQPVAVKRLTSIARKSTINSNHPTAHSWTPGGKHYVPHSQYVRPSNPFEGPEGRPHFKRPRPIASKKPMRGIETMAWKDPIRASFSYRKRRKLRKFFRRTK